jgi:hypothetical protein
MTWEADHFWWTAKLGENTVIAYFKVLFKHLPRGTEEIRVPIISVWRGES